MPAGPPDQSPHREAHSRTGSAWHGSSSWSAPRSARCCASWPSPRSGRRPRPVRRAHSDLGHLAHAPPPDVGAQHSRILATRGNRAVYRRRLLPPPFAASAATPPPPLRAVGNRRRGAKDSSSRESVSVSIVARSWFGTAPLLVWMRGRRTGSSFGKVPRGRARRRIMDTLYVVGILHVSLHKPAPRLHVVLVEFLLGQRIPE